jgi:hypothetical protein
MVISHKAETVQVVSMVDCKDLNEGADPRAPGPVFMEFGKQAWNSNGEEDLGIHSTVQTNNIAHTVAGQKVETWYREDLTKLASELMQITNLDRTKARRRRVEVNEISEKGHGNQGSFRLIRSVRYVQL